MHVFTISLTNIMLMFDDDYHYDNDTKSHDS